MLTIPSPRPANRHVSPFEGGWGDVKFTNRHISRSADRHISRSANPHISRSANRHLSPSY